MVAEQRSRKMAIGSVAVKSIVPTNAENPEEEQEQDGDEGGLFGSDEEDDMEEVIETPG